MKIIIAGDGKVGSLLTSQLSSEGHDLTLVDSNPKVLEASIERYDVMAIQGNCATMETLYQAGVREANLLIAATSSDEVNLLCCMTAHSMNPNLHTIARVRNPEYADQVYRMRDVFGLSMLVNPEKQAAIEIDRLIRFPGFLKRDSFAKGRVEIVELKVDEHNKLCNIPLKNMSTVAKCRVLVCAVLRGGQAVAPDGNFILKEGDRIFVTAPTNNLSKMLENLGITRRKAKRVMICGGSRVAYYLAQCLQKTGIEVQLIEKDHTVCVHLAELLPNIMIIEGDASNQELLESEGIERCDALVSLTGLDELNMVIAMYGSSYHVPQLITKIARIKNNSLLNRLDIGSVISPKELCCNTITRYVRAMEGQMGEVVTVHSIADGQAEAMEFVVTEKTLHCNETLKNIKLRDNVLIASITHAGQIEIPNGDSCYTLGDTVVVVTSRGVVLHQLNDIFA
ncbi:MAG: Trk system potassium transporter TrkA [Muricoprocola sp.]